MKLKCIYISLILTLASFSIVGQTSEIPIEQKFYRVSGTYGFVLGQEISLLRIQKEYPHLEMQVISAKSSFNLAFGKSVDKIKEYLNETIGAVKFQEYETLILQELNKIIYNQVIDEQTSLDFIHEVESRAKGNIPSSFLETLLYYQYSDKPHLEFISGFTNVFTTKGHIKSKGTDWLIRVPKSWKAEEADRPNIIQKFTSDYGDGKQSVMLLVKEIPMQNGHKLTQDDINSLFVESEAKSMIPDDSKFISFTKMTFDGNLGGMLEYETTVERIGITISVRTIQFMFIVDNRWYLIQCSVSKENANTNLEKEMTKYLPLYKLMANSIVVVSNY